MKLDFPPRFSERIGAISLHAVQKIYELDSGKSPEFHGGHRTIRAFDHDELSSIFRDLAIVIPIKNERLRLIEGVLSGIPNECMVVIVSNSQISPVNRFSMEVEMIKQYSQFADKKIIIIHQGDPDLAKIFEEVKYTSILDPKKQIRDGKAEGMIIGILMAKMHNKKYVGFIDSDNYFPGAVNEYCKIYAVGFGMASTPYNNIRISWLYKPKIRNNILKFPKWGRTSEVTNKYLNALLSYITGFETDIIKTGNSGEHALSMSLAENLNYSSGYSIEPYEFINILEKFGGLLPTDSPDIVEKGVEIFQIETRNPHFHEEKGKDHLTEMLQASLLSISNSKVCNMELAKEIKEHLLRLETLYKKDKSGKTDAKKYFIMDPIKTIPIDKFGELVIKNVKTFHKI
jgi:mannosyl-3-phosphoglycerate synthase